IEIGDLGTIPTYDEPEAIYERFDRIWKKECDRTAKLGKKPGILRVTRDFVGWEVWTHGFTLAVVQATAQISVPFISQIIIENLSGMHPLTPVQQGFTILSLIILPLIAGFCQSRLMMVCKRASMHLYVALTIAVYRKSL